MKAKFTFNLPEETYEYNVFCKADNLLDALHEFSTYLTAQVKYADTPDNIEAVRRNFEKTLSNNGIDLDELI